MTDLYRAGVLRIVQQPHCAVAFPVQTPDAAAHQSAQHLLGGLRTGPQRRAYIQVWICCHVNDAPASALRSNTWSAAASVRSGGGGGASFVSSACKRREGGGGWCVSSLGARVFFFLENSATACAAAPSLVRLDCHPSPHLPPPLVSSPLPCRSNAAGRAEGG